MFTWLLLLIAVAFLLVLAGVFAVATVVSARSGRRSWALEGAVLVSLMIIAAAGLLVLVASG